MNLTQTVTWIPVEERLPEKAGWYPVALPNGETRLDFWLKRDRYWMAHGKKPVTHWAEPLKHPSELADAPDIVAQRDDLLSALQNTYTKLREDSPNDPMEPFAYDSEWEKFAISADAAISNALK